SSLMRVGGGSGERVVTNVSTVTGVDVGLDPAPPIHVDVPQSRNVPESRPALPPVPSPAPAEPRPEPPRAIPPYGGFPGTVRAPSGTVTAQNMQDLGALVEDEKPAKESLKVWQADGKRPTVARVYVGDGNALEPVSLHVTVTVEGPRARTLIDQVFRNP